MIQKLLQVIIGQAADGQRKMALGVFVIGLLFLLAAASLVAIWTLGAGDGAETKLQLLRGVSDQTIAGIVLTFGILAGANILGDHLGGALKAKFLANAAQPPAAKP